MTMRDLTPWNLGRKTSDVEGDYFSAQTLHNRMNRLLDEFFTGSGMVPFGRMMHGTGSMAPRIDVSEGEKEYKISAELPGVDEKDVEVTLANGTLTIKGEKKTESKGKNDHYFFTERSYGAFQRSFSLPSDIDDGKVKASFDHGVLTVKVAKNKAAKSAIKRIEVNKAA
jgi:HSP20 family protein